MNDFLIQRNIWCQNVVLSIKVVNTIITFPANKQNQINKQTNKRGGGEEGGEERGGEEIQ
jgi:hypothetical protein